MFPIVFLTIEMAGIVCVSSWNDLGEDYDMGGDLNGYLSPCLIMPPKRDFHLTPKGARMVAISLVRMPAAHIKFPVHAVHPPISSLTDSSQTTRVDFNRKWHVARDDQQPPHITILPPHTNAPNFTDTLPFI